MCVYVWVCFGLLGKGGTGWWRGSCGYTYKKQYIFAYRANA